MSPLTSSLLFLGFKVIHCSAPLVKSAGTRLTSPINSSSPTMSSSYMLICKAVVLGTVSNWKLSFQVGFNARKIRSNHIFKFYIS
jgi:hypothetical protein